MRFPYDQSYVPPAPHVLIWIGAPGRALSVGPLDAFVDSGADATILPASYLYPLRLQVDSQKRLISPWGGEQFVSTYFVDMGIDDLHLSYVEVVADEQNNEIILGRNVLNKLRVVLDGLKQMVEVYPS